MANTHNYISDSHQTHIGLENHADDFVGVVFGQNPATFGQRPPDSNAAKEAGKVLFSYPSPHACYGHADQACRHDYGLSHRIHVDSINLGSKK
ncbi:hypothetical protein GCM10023261_18100 [Bartonella jaculi]|uniref:Uncharacterized protein n=1 Tax=Bartonella jaculi TaxID=686226 RepID=A0ABP8VAI4_9HYPH